MKLVTAVIKPHKLDDVKEALTTGGVQGLTITEVSGFGRQRGHTETYRGAEYNVDLVPKVMLEIVVEDPDSDRIVKLVSEAATSGKIGDGKIWVTSVDQVTRIRTGEQGTDAL